MKLVFILLVIALLKSIFAYKVYHSLPVVELRRRARAHDARAEAMYKIVAYDQTLDLLLYIFGIASAVTLVIWTARINWWAAVVTMLAIVVLNTWVRVAPGGWLWSFGAWLAPFYAKILSYIRPLLEPAAKLLPASAPVHVGIYERDDLLEVLKKQNKRIDNRIPERDLRIAAGALTFSDKLVAKFMTPRRAVHFVSEDDVLGPTLLDELHKTGFSRFPVVKGSAKVGAPTVTGTLYLKDVIEIGQENKGKVKDHMKPGAYFINESCDLLQALDAILKKHHHQLIVVNNFEEVTGVITLEDILEQILGEQVVDEFDHYESLREVAGLEARRERAHHQEVPAASQPVAEPADVPAAIAKDPK